jgi:hypothetical protein
MKYCHSCGLKIELEDVFCANCGTKLFDTSESIENQTNENHTKVNQESVGYNTSVNSKIKDAAHEVANSFNTVHSKKALNVLIKMFLHPVSGAKDFIEKGTKNSVIVITVLLTCIQGLLGVWKLNQFFSILEDMSINLIKSFATLSRLIDGSSSSLPNLDEIHEITSKIGEVKSFLDIPYAKIFFQNSILFLVAIGVLFVIIYLAINILSKNKPDAFSIYKTALIVLVPTLYFEIFSIILSYLSLYIGSATAIIGLIISLACLTIILKEKFLTDENHPVFVTAVAFVLVCIVILMCLQKFLVSNLTDVIASFRNITDLLR